MFCAAWHFVEQHVQLVWSAPFNHLCIMHGIYVLPIGLKGPMQLWNVLDRKQLFLA